MNIQQNIITGIREQLYFNNYLVLPGFGGFVLRSQPAHFSASGGQLLPPSKTVGFNVQLKQNDGIMVHWLQNRLGCNAAEALAHLNDFSGYCNSVLTAKRRLTLQDIGFFYLDFETNICFEPQKDTNFLTESFGLTPLAVRELAPEIREPRKLQTFEDRPAVAVQPEKIPARRKINYTRPLALFTGAVLFFSLLLFVVSNTHIGGQIQSSLGGSTAKKQYSPLAYAGLELRQPVLPGMSYVADANGVANLEMGAGISIPVKVFETLKPKEDMITASGAYEVVVGCFSVPENARKMVQKLERTTPGIAVRGKNAKGMFVVAMSFATKEEALKNLEQVKRSVPSAWIKKSDKL